MIKRIEITKGEAIESIKLLKELRDGFPECENPEEKEIKAMLQQAITVGIESINALIVICEGRAIRTGETAPQTKRYIINPNKEKE